MQQERVRQTELAQMRDQLFRQELWEQRQSIREVLRKGFRALLDDSKSHIAAYELARLMEIDFKSGVRATAPTGFTFDGPVPANPQFEAEMEKVYGKPMPLDQLLDLMLLAHPDKEEMIRAKINAAAAAGYPFSNPDLMKYLDPSEKIAIASPSSAAPPPSSSNSPSTPETTREPAVKPCLTQHATCNPTLPSRPPAPVTPHSRQHSELETRNFYHVSRGELGTNVPLPPRILNRHLDPATLHSRAAAMERYIDSTLQQREPASTKPSAVPVPPDPTPPNDA
jgi:hypothetical protein